MSTPIARRFTCLQSNPYGLPGCGRQFDARPHWTLSCPRCGNIWLKLEPEDVTIAEIMWGGPNLTPMTYDQLQKRIAGG